MTTAPATSRFERAVLRHFAGVKGLRGVQAYVGRRGEWTEIARLGEALKDKHVEVLRKFDPNAGGAVEALEGANAGWMATYMVGGPGLDMTVLMHMQPQKPQELQAKLKTIEASVGWLMVAALEDHSEVQDQRAFVGEIGVQILLDAARARSRRMLADQWIARLEKAVQPSLVAVQWVPSGKPRLSAVSGGGTIERQSDLRGVLEQLATKAVSRRAPVSVLPNVSLNAESALAKPDDAGAAEDGTDDVALVERLGGGSAMIVPVFRRSDVVAVVSIVFEPEAQTATLLSEAPVQDLSELLSEAYQIRERAFPSLLRRLGNWIGRALRGLFGTRFWKLKTALVLALGAGALAYVSSTQVRPDFVASVEAQDRRVVSAPFDGFLASAPFQTGDAVREGDLLVALEEADLRLEIQQTQAELAEIAADLQSAQAQRDAARTQLLGSRIAQGEVALDLLQRQLNLARTTAQQPAVIVGGDAWRRIGDRVRLGEPLLEVAAADSFRVRAFVEEDWVAEIEPGAEATLLLTAFPGAPNQMRVDGIGADPMAIEGANAFPIWLSFETQPDLQLLDGMRGVVRIDVGERRVLDAYSRGLQRWARRTLWRWRWD